MKHRFFRRFCLFILFLSVLALVCVGAIVIYAANNIDYTADDVMFSNAEEDSVITLYGILEDGSYGVTETVCLSEFRKEYKQINEIPNSVKYAFLCAEDRTFYYHHGVNLKRTVYAAVNAITKSEPRFGASTITQQVIKNISGDSEVTVKRKFHEILRALRLEKNYSKDKILEVYLNIVPFSSGLVGVGSGAEIYFGKDVSQLSYAEAATLAGITNAPSKYDPYSHPESCLEKRNIVLQSMYECQVLTEEEYRSEIEKPLGVDEKPKADAQIMSWFAEKVISDVAREYAEKHDMTVTEAKTILSKLGVKIDTTEDKRIDNIVNKTLQNSAKLPNQCQNGLFFSMVITNPKTGELLALCGKSGKKTGNLVSDFSSLPRAPGSTLKSIALYAPLIEEKKITSATVFDDVPTDFYGSIPYPVNSPNRYMGLCTVADALRLSKNTVAMRLYSLRGKEAIYQTLTSDYGFSTIVRKKTENGQIYTDLAPSPLALGQLTYGVSLYDMTSAYSVFSGDGKLSHSFCYTTVKDKEGNVILEHETSQKQVFSKETARVMCQLLRSVVDDGTAKKITLKNRAAVAGKTGTSGDCRDKWFIGFTPELCAGILCGYETGNQSVSGLSVDHLTLWNEIMTKVYQLGIYQKRSFSTSGLCRATYCMDSGCRLCESCKKDPRGNRAKTSWFIPGTEPKEKCQTHVPVYYDEKTKSVACPECPEKNLRVISLLRLPNRSFKAPIYVADAEYGYVEMPENVPYCDDETMPYYGNLLLPDENIGLLPDKKKFNSYCSVHEIYD